MASILVTESETHFYTELISTLVETKAVSMSVCFVKLKAFLSSFQSYRHLFVLSS